MGQVQVAKTSTDSSSSEDTEEKVLRGEIQTNEEEEEMEVRNLGDFSSSNDEVLLQQLAAAELQPHGEMHF